MTETAADARSQSEYDPESTPFSEGTAMSDISIPIPGVGVGVGGININVGGGDLGIPVTPDDEIETDASEAADALD